MTPDRWERVSALCHAALELSEVQRETFLREACGGDDALDREVRSLLRFGAAADTFLEHPAAEAVAPLSSSTTVTSPATAVRFHPFRIVILAVSVIPFTAVLVAGAAIWQHGARRADLGWDIRGRQGLVSEVNPAGPAAGKLRVGDRVTAIDGDPRVVPLGLTWKSRSLRPETPYRVEFERDGTPYETTLQYRLVDSGDTPVLVARLFVAVTWIVVALSIGLARPAVPAARLAALAGLCLGLEGVRGVISPLLTSLGTTSAWFYGLIVLNMTVQIVLPYHAMYRFPTGVPSGRFWSAMLVALYALAPIHFIFALLVGSKYFLAPNAALSLERTVNPFGFQPSIASPSLVGFAAAMTVAVAIRNLRRVADPDQRRRVKWILFATVVAGSMAVSNAVLTPASGTMDALTDLTLLVVPLALAYSILRHRVFGISVVIRLSIQYMLAQKALSAVIIMPAALMILAVAKNPDVTVRDVLLGRSVYPILIITGAAALMFRRRLTESIDRRFFREAYDRERLLQGILSDIDALESSQVGVRQIIERLDVALHPTSIQMWFAAGERERERLHLLHSHGSQPLQTGTECILPAPFVHLLEHDAATFVGGLPEEGVVGSIRRQLYEIGAEFVIPMLGRDGRLRGALMLGAKRSEEPYTPADLELLQRIAMQLGAVREHAELVSRVQEDSRIRHEVLGRISEGRISLLKECPRCRACYDSDKDRCDLDGAELTLSLPIERTIAGRYRLNRQIGYGGMGAVYDALDERLKRRVAVKVMLGRNFGNRDALRRFDREARAVARLSHSSIVAVFDYGPLAGQGAFLVMEYVEGTTLRSLLATASVYPSPDCVIWIEQILTAIGVAHAHGVIHRDLKPENVLVATRPHGAGCIKVLDFGLATFRGAPGDDTASVTAPGMTLGTLAYMAPEQMVGRPVDERADIFSLGVIVSEILTGTRPFSANPLIRAVEIARGLPDGAFGNRPLRDVIARYVHEDPARRYATVAESGDALLPVLREFLHQRVHGRP